MYKKSLIAISKVGQNKGAPRIWFESNRLKSLGFDPSARINLRAIPNGIRLTATDRGERKVSSKRGVPVIDLNSFKALSPFNFGEDVKVTSSRGVIEIVPSLRTFHIREANAAKSVFRVLELFAGGGTFHDALKGLDQYKVVGALEMEARYLNVYDMKADEVPVLLQGDIRDFEPEDFPKCDIIVAGLPCTDHSLAGRTKKKLSVPENGAVGNLYVDVLPVVRRQRPLGVVIENVPSYLTSEAGINLVRVLRQWGYSVTYQVIDPTDWGEITSRKRCVIVATLRGEFRVKQPNIQKAYVLNDFLDPEDPIQDAIDAERDAHSVRYLAERSRKMAEQGNGWRHTIFPRNYSGKVPTVTKGYYKRQPQSWMISTPGLGAGARMLRKEEIARIHGHSFPDDISTTLSTELSGQGVMSRVFSSIFADLSDFLNDRYACQEPPLHLENEQQLELF